MRVATILLTSAVLVTLAACEEPYPFDPVDAAAPDGDPTPQANTAGVDVIVRPGAVDVYARPVEGCTCTAGVLPPADGCATWSDAVSCTCAPWPGSCLTEVSVVRQDGTIVSATDLSRDFGPRFTIAADLLGGDGAELLLRGCGEDITVPINGLDWPTVAITALTQDDAGVHVSWETGAGSPGGPAEHVLVTAGGGFSAEVCDDGPAGTRTFATGVTGVSVQALSTSGGDDTALGPVRIMIGGRATQTP
ncbi:MAG: hypothetical protein H6708_29340 [Kofleriaceae bacterium]|nr:hypothetical protein [Kofleriaceae bacterium]